MSSRAPLARWTVAHEDPKSALMVLAEVYRRTRELWPLGASAVGSTVTVRIDAIKELDCGAVLQPAPGLLWVMTKQSSKEPWRWGDGMS